MLLGFLGKTINASKVSSTCVQMCGFCHILKGSQCVSHSYFLHKCIHYWKLSLKLYSAKEWHIVNTLIPSIRLCNYSFGEFVVAVRLVGMFWLLPQSSHFARAMEVAVKGKSPSYLHLFPHSSAGERGGFSKPGGKLTSITLVSPFKALNLNKLASNIDVSYIVVCKIYLHEHIWKYWELFFIAWDHILWGTWYNSVSAYGFTRSF